jgi:hypothetical protein
MERRAFLLDSSGSMDTVLEDTIGGFNSFVRSQIPLGGTLSLYTFSNTCTCVYKDVPINDVKPLTRETYVPGGTTSLYDAMGKVLKEHDSGTIVILTDGQENTSKEYTKSHIKDLIRLSVPQSKVIYVGVDLEDASDLGIDNTIEYTPERTPELFRHVSESVASTVETQMLPRLARTVGSIGAIGSNSPPSTYQMDPMSLPSQNVDEDISSYAHDPYV